MSRLLPRRDLFRYGVAGGFTLWLFRPNFADAATVFNIHYGLSAWASGSFTQGQRCSASGNAYQCTTPGSSSAAPSGTGGSINNGGTAVFKYLSAIDFTSLQNWANAMPATQTVNYLVQLWNNGVITTSLNTAFMQYTATAGSFSTVITPAPGEGLTGNVTAAGAWNPANGVAFDCPASGTESGGLLYNYLNTNNVTFSGLQFRDLNASAGALMFGTQANVSNLLLTDCILDGYNFMYNGSGTSGCGLTNCLMINRQTSPADFPVKWEVTSTSGFMVNCVAVGVGGGAQCMACSLSNSAGAVFVRNCYFSGAAGEPLLSQNASGAIIADHCAFDVSSSAAITGPADGFPNGDGGNNLYSKPSANQFISNTTNFRLKTGSDCIGAGVVDLTDIPNGLDLYGVAHGASVWDIGPIAFALSGHGGVGALPLLGVG